MTSIFYGNTVVVAPQLTWVRVIKYCELSGETKAAVASKCKSGLWIEGVQWKIARDGKKRINLAEVDLWIQYDGNLPARLKSQRASRRGTLKRATV